MLLLICNDPSPCALVWGPAHALVYNNAYPVLIGRKHPAAQGQSCWDVFPEFWTDFSKKVDQCFATGVPLVETNLPIPMDKRGFIEEAYYTFKYVSIIGDRGLGIALHATVTETTRDVLREREAVVYNAVNKEISNATTVSNVWKCFITGVQVGDKDVPIALLYGSDIRASEDFGVAGRTRYLLKGSVGLSEGHMMAPMLVDINGDSWLSRPMHDVKSSQCSMTISVDNLALDLTNIEWRGNGMPSRELAVFPLTGQESDSTDLLGSVVIALNPRRPYDQDYAEFLET